MQEIGAITHDTSALILLYTEAQAIVFPFRPHRSETWSIPLFRERLGRTNDINTIEYAPFRQDTAEMENDQSCHQLLRNVVDKCR